MMAKQTTFYSDTMLHADYYKWANGASYTDYGYFVSFEPGDSTITICNACDVFGVTVARAAFVGNQDLENPRQSDYALVATQGIVAVRCESDVTVGDYVISNTRGEAEKTTSECGYKVIAVYPIDDIAYAAITLGVQAYTTDLLGRNVKHLGERLDDADDRIMSAMNIAAIAYNKAQEAAGSSDVMGGQVADVVDKVDDLGERVDDLSTQVSDITVVSEQAKAIADGAVTSAESARVEAVTAANDATSKVADLTSTLTPILTWESDDGQYQGASFVDYFDNENIKTKGQIETLTTQTEEYSSAILQNGKGIEMIVSSVDKYSVGEYSQARGLTLEQARSILKKDIIYIPIKQGQDTYTHSEKYADGTESPREFVFSCGFYYIWDGECWNEDNTQCVALPYIENLGNNIPVGGGSLKFWFTDSNTAPEGYEPMALYMWDEVQDENGDTSEQWVKVNTLAGNVNNRITSMIRQDVDSVTAEIVNAYGSVAGFGAQLSDTTAKANMAATWVLENDPSAGDSTIRNVAAVDISADQDGSQMALVVSQKDGNRTVKGASIVMDQNGTDSHIAISADNIVMDGTTTFIAPGDLSGEGTTEINGANITTGKIDAERIKVEDLQALGATIAGWKINDNELSYQDTDNKIEVGLSPANGGAYNDGQDNLGLVLYAGQKADGEPRAIAGTWRFTEASDVIKDFLQNAYLTGSVEFAFYGWFNHPTSGWTKYEGQSATLTFDYSGEEDFNITLSVDNSSAQTLWSCIPRYGSEDNFSDCLLNREIGFGAEGIEDVWIGDYLFGTNILSSIATFIPGSIGLYPSMLDKDGRLYAQEVRLGGSADSVIEVGRCAVGNLVINNDAIVYKKGWGKAGGFYLGKNGLSVGENFGVQNKGVSTASIIVGNAASAHTDGTVACRTLYLENTSTKNTTHYKTSVELSANSNPAGSDANVTGGLYWTTNNIRTGLTYYADVDDPLIALVGNWKDSGGSTAVTSDARLKHDIENLDSRYDVFFDNLLPQRFKYDIGTSDRYHTGYTTQGVQKALETAEILEQEFAGIVTYNQGTEDEESALRYYEFVSLNTDQIQKLKKRVDALEAKNAELEVKNAELEARLAKLEALLINNAE